MENRDIINAHTPAGFEPVILGDGELRVYVSQSNGVTFTKGVVKSLNNPEYIEISVNKASRQLAVRACAANEKSAIRCKMNSAGGYRLKRCELITIVAEAMGIDVLRRAYRAGGYLREGDGVLIFEFSMAVRLKRGGAKSHGEEK